MDNNGNFEQQFTQNLKDGTSVAQLAEPTTNNSKLPLIVAIVLGVITLLETIALIISLTNRPTTTSFEEGDEYLEEANVGDDDYAGNFNYDNELNLTSFNATCTSNDGASYSFNISNKYNFSGSPAASGSYTITNSDLISLTDSNKVLYYNGIYVADGLTVYMCEEPAESEEE